MHKQTITVDGIKFTNIAYKQIIETLKNSELYKSRSAFNKGVVREYIPIFLDSLQYLAKTEGIYVNVIQKMVWISRNDKRYTLYRYLLSGVSCKDYIEGGGGLVYDYDIAKALLTKAQFEKWQKAGPVATENWMRRFRDMEYNAIVTALVTIIEAIHSIYITIIN